MAYILPSYLYFIFNSLFGLNGAVMVSIVSVVPQTLVQNSQYFTKRVSFFFFFFSAAVLFNLMFVSVQSVMDVYGFV